jgi:hypothetical protein
MRESTLKSPHVLAEIYYLSPLEGGRSNGVASGYRGQIYLNSYDWGAAQEFLGRDFCELGETVFARIQFIYAHEFLDFKIGTSFSVREGSKIVGRGIIKDVFHNNIPTSSLNRSLYKMVDDVLWKEWDPLGVNTFAEARDEYHSYIMGVVVLLIKDSPLDIIADHLNNIETETMGLFGNKTYCSIVAKKLIESYQGAKRQATSAVVQPGGRL